MVLKDLKPMHKPELHPIMVLHMHENQHTTPTKIRYSPEIKCIATVADAEQNVMCAQNYL